MSDPANDLSGEDQVAIEATLNGRRVQRRVKARQHLAEVEANRVRAKAGAHGGVKRSEWTRRAEDAQKDLERAQRDLADLPEEARQAEVPAGWFASED